MSVLCVVQNTKHVHMKKTNQESRLQGLAIAALILLALLLSVSIAWSQENRSLGIFAKTGLSGTGLAAELRAGIEGGAGAHSLNVSLSWQHISQRITGTNLEYRLRVTESLSGRSALYFAAGIGYRFKSSLSRGTMEREQRIFPEKEFDYRSIRVSLMEYKAGFGLNTHLTNALSCSFQVDAGAYSGISRTPVPGYMYRDDSGASLWLSFGLHYTIKY